MNTIDTRNSDRESLLAELADCYYLHAWTQQKIADTFGLTRPTVSRMLKEAQERGIVEIKIRGRTRLDRGLATRLAQRFGLAGAEVVVPRDGEDDLTALGVAGARMLRSLSFDGMTVGLTWGSTASSVIDAIEGWAMPRSTVVQLAGSLGASAGQFDSSSVSRAFANAINAQLMMLSSPLLVEDEEMVRVLFSNPSNKTTYEQSLRCDLVLEGIGVVDTEHSSLRLGGHLSEGELHRLRLEGAVGDVCGHMIGADGRAVGEAFSRRQVNLSRADLLKVPVRLTVAGGAYKTDAIRGALLGGYVTHLVTSYDVASELAEEK